MYGLWSDTDGLRDSLLLVVGDELHLDSLVHMLVGHYHHQGSVWSLESHALNTTFSNPPLSVCRYQDSISVVTLHLMLDSHRILWEELAEVSQPVVHGVLVELVRLLVDDDGGSPRSCKPSWDLHSYPKLREEDCWFH